MARMPGATWRPVQNFRAGGSTEQRGLVLHVQEGNNSPWPWFNNPESQASSDFWVGKDGTVEQYVNTGADRAWAQANGNAFYASVETEGYTGEALTDAQVEGVARIYAWGHQEFGWPLVVVDSTTAKGLTYHGAGGDAWGGHPDCPGELRKAQRPAIIARAGELLGDAAPAPQVPAPTGVLQKWPGRYLRHPGRDGMMHGQDVTDLQARLAKRGWRISVDGWYGPQTAATVALFQRNHGLDQDGIVGPLTWAAIFTPMDGGQ